MKVLSSILLFISSSMLLMGQHRSVMIHDGEGICEPSIKVDPSNPMNVVAGMVLDYAAYSNDGGETWRVNRIKSPYGVWGDPVIDVDTAGRFYYFHLSNPTDGDWIDRIVCQRSDDNGVTWNKGSFTGLNGAKDQDKHWSIVDPVTNVIHLTWTEFDKYGSKDSTCMSRIQYSQSVDAGDTWVSPVTISSITGDCIDDDETTEGAVPAIGPDGEIYVSWAGPDGLVFSRSLDKGKTWTKEKQIDPMPGGWTYDVPAIYRANGLPITKCDLSSGPYRGRIYVNWSDQRNGLDNTDVWLSYSDDKGDSWSDPIRVNQDEGTAHQFFTWMDIDQTNGTLYFVYYDRRNAGGTDRTEVYMSITVDGGGLIYDFPLEDRDKAFIPTSKVFFGDYNNLSVQDGIVRPIWTRLEKEKLSVWTSIVDTDHLGNGLYRFEIEAEVRPNKDYCLIYKENGKKRILKKTISDRAKIDFDYIWDVESLAPGVYSLELVQGNKVLWAEQIEWNGGIK